VQSPPVAMHADTTPAFVVHDALRSPVLFHDTLNADGVTIDGSARHPPPLCFGGGDDDTPCRCEPLRPRAACLCCDQACDQRCRDVCQRCRDEAIVPDADVAVARIVEILD